MPAKSIGNNVSAEVKGNKLILTIDLSKNLGPSKSGKSLLVGSTGGNKTVGEGKDAVKVGVNIYKPVAE